MIARRRSRGVFARDAPCGHSNNTHVDPAMTRQPKNEAFARTSFLQGANAAYIEEMQAQYERNPGSVSDEWRHFFASLHEEQKAGGQGNGPGNGHGPSWARPLETPEGDRDLLGALTGDYGEVEQHIRGRLQAKAYTAGFELSPAVSLRATQDSIRALMLIRAYRVMGHLAADLDPLGLSRAQEAQGAAARDLRVHRGRHRPPHLHRQGAGPRDGDHPRDPEDPAPHLLPPHRRRVHAHHLAGAEVLDPGAHRGPGQGHRLHRRGQEGHPQQADRGGAVREVRRRQVYGHQAFRPRRRGGDGAGARADHQARRPARHQGDRHRHGAPRAPQRARQRDGQAAPRHLQRVQGRLVQARRRGRLGRRQVSPGRLLRPRLRRQQCAPLAHGQSFAPGDRRPRRARQGARQAGPAQLQGGRAHAGAAAADPRGRGLRRPGRGGRVLRPLGPQGPPHRRLDPLHHQQPDRLHHQSALLALLALLLGRGQDGGGADLPRERRQPGSRGARRQDRHRVPPALPEAGRDRHVLLSAARPQRIRTSRRSRNR